MGPLGRPGLRYIGTSYSERYAKRDNARTRNLITSEWYQGAGATRSISPSWVR